MRDDALWFGMSPDEKAREIARLDYEDFRTEAVERLKIQQSLGLSVLRNLYLVNGGAIVALFTFIGNADKGGSVDTRAMWFAFLWFVIGLVATLLSNTSAYFMQVQYYVATLDQAWVSQARALGADREMKHERPFQLGSRWEGAAVIFSITALVAFVVGSAIALGGVLRL